LTENLLGFSSLAAIVDGSIMGAIGAGVTFWLPFRKIDK
jgi:hypothetical protein